MRPGPGGAGVSRSDSHCIPKSWANWMASAGLREISSVMALTRELSMRFGAAGAEVAAAGVAARNVRRFISHLGVRASRDLLYILAIQLLSSLLLRRNRYALDLHRSGLDRRWHGAVAD